MKESSFALVFLIIWLARSEKDFERGANEAMSGEPGLLTTNYSIQGDGEDVGTTRDNTDTLSTSEVITPTDKTPPFCWLPNHTCSGRCDQSSRVFGGKVSLCKCDHLCVIYGDCCFDFLRECFNLTQDGQLEPFVNSLSFTKKHRGFVNVNENVSQSKIQDIATSCSVTFRELLLNATLESLFSVQGCFQCKQLTIYANGNFSNKFLQVLTKCPVREKQSIRVACESHRPFLFNIPVQDIKEPALIYRNIHCAICHGKEVADVSHWSPVVSCPNTTRLGEIIRHSSSEIKEYIERECWIAYTPLGSGWTLAECPNDHLFISLPMKNKINSTSMNIEVRLCQLYFRPVYPSHNRRTIYRNVHCANLNGVRNLRCHDIEKFDWKHKGVSLDVVRPLSVLFNFKNSVVGIQYGEEIIYLSAADSEKCTENEIYSFLSQRCERNFASKVPQKTNISIDIDVRVISDVCGVIPDIDSVLASTLLLSEDKDCVTPGDTEFSLATRQGNAIRVTAQQPSAIVNLLLAKLDGINTKIVKSKTTCGWWHIDYNELNNLENKGIGMHESCERKIDILIESDDLAWKTFVVLLKNLGESIDKYTGIFYNPDRGLILEYRNIRVTNQNRDSPNTCPPENRTDMVYTVNATDPWILIINQEPLQNINLRDSEFFLNHQFSSTSINGRYELKICDHFGSRGLRGFRNCSAVLSVDNTKYWTQDEKMYISVNLTVFKTSKYQKLNDTMYFCADSLIKVPGVFRDNSVLTLVSLILSLIALLFVIMTYTFFLPLRNVPGKIVIGLTSSLFCAMLLFLFGIGQTRYPVLCTIMAALLHFFWLASFFWTTVLSFNLAQTFGSKTKNVGYDRNRFLHYSIYSFAGPLLVVLVTLLKGFFNKPDSWVHGSYGSAAACWISQRWVNIVAFGLPVGLSVVINTALFVYTVRGLYKISKITKLVRNKENRGQSTILYFKLSLIMGLSWALFYLSAALDNELLQALSIVFNGLQGVFLFLVFVCNKRVYNLYKDMFHNFAVKVKGQKRPGVNEITLTSNHNRI